MGQILLLLMALINKTTKKYQRVKESETTFQCAKKLKYKIKTTRGLQKMNLKNYIHWTKNGSNFVTVDGINKKKLLKSTKE